MKLKTVIELLTLSTSLYAISKDEKLMNDIKGLASKGMDNLDKWYHEMSKNEYDEYDEDIEDQKVLVKVMNKAAELKKELEQKIEEVAQKVYEKMHIAHTQDLANLKEEVEKLKLELQQKDQRISVLENTISTK